MRSPIRRRARASWVTADASAERVALHVADEGPGIPADVLPRVFDKFVKAGGESSRADGGQGTGLGLAIAKGIMEAHRGSITAESPAPSGPWYALHADFPARRKARMSAKTRVLVVDDESRDPALSQARAGGEWLRGDERRHRRGRLEACRGRNLPDIILLDLGLPDGDGKDVIRQVRQWSDCPRSSCFRRASERPRRSRRSTSGPTTTSTSRFNVGELMARMRAATRHRMQRKAETPVLRVGDLEIDSVRHRATRASNELKLDAEGIRASVIPCTPHRSRPDAQNKSSPRSGDPHTSRTPSIFASTLVSCGKRSNSGPTIRGSF